METKQLTYSEKLRHPKWQKKRLEILQRDDFKCQSPGCFNEDKTLHVHHLDYEKDAEPWDYPNEWLITLCEDCHQQVTEQRPIQEKAIIHALRLKVHDSWQFHCTEVVFGHYKDLGGLMYLLWELDEDKVMNLLVRLFNKGIPDEYLTDINQSDAKQNATRLDGK